MITGFIMNFIQKCFSHKYIVLSLKSDGILKDGKFIPFDLTTHEIVDKSLNLVLPKGKYKISHRDSLTMEESRSEAVGMLVIDNSHDAYDRFWGDKDVLDNYLCESRLSFYQELLTACKNEIRGTVLDIGCGSGDFLKLVHESNPQCDIHGFDFAESAIQRCRNIMPKGTFISGDIYSTKYPDSTFDTVLCIEVLEHLEDPQKALLEITRICRTNGSIIISVPNGAFDSYVGHLNFWSEISFKTLLDHVTIQSFNYLEKDRTMLFVVKKP